MGSHSHQAHLTHSTSGCVVRLMFILFLQGAGCGLNLAHLGVPSARLAVSPQSVLIERVCLTEANPATSSLAWKRKTRLKGAGQRT